MVKIQNQGDNLKMFLVDNHVHLSAATPAAELIAFMQSIVRVVLRVSNTKYTVKKALFRHSKLFADLKGQHNLAVFSAVVVVRDATETRGRKNLRSDFGAAYPGGF